MVMNFYTDTNEYKNNSYKIDIKKFSHWFIDRTSLYWITGDIYLHSNHDDSGYTLYQVLTDV